MDKIISFLLVVLFMASLFFYIKGSNPKYREKMTNMNMDKNRCPNILIQKGAKYYLYNSKLVQVPGVNPVEFDNLEDYTKFLEWQRSQGIRCPVLFLQETLDAQGQRVYKSRPSVSEMQVGMMNSPLTTTESESEYTLLVDSNHDDAPYNYGGYPAFDNSTYYTGKITPLDDMNTKAQQQAVSPNPMDDNWGGADYTQKLVDEGYYKGNEVSLYVP